MDFQQARHSIDSVVQWIRSGRLGLPDFQRDFVWSPSQIAELLDSVARQWPIGSLLLLRGPQNFAFREIDTAPPLDGDSLDVYILDGQQRVTALYHAVSNVSKYCYFVDFKELQSGGEIIRWSGRSAFERQYRSVEDRARSGIALVSDIWDQPKFFNWLNFVSNDSSRQEYLQLRDEKLSGLQSKVYYVMTLELEQGIGLEALARIFETINRTGVALNAFDLLVAKLYPTNFNLRERWDDALEVYPMLRHFLPNELEILKLVALLIRERYGKQASRGVRQGDLLSLDEQGIIELWDEAVERYVTALKVAVSFGVVCKELVPNWSMILGLVGCQDKLTEKETLLWWRAAIVRQSFAQGANTKIVAEFDAHMRSTDSAAVNEQILQDIGQRSVRSNGLLANGFFSLMIRAGARDPQTNQLLSHASAVVPRNLAADGVITNIRKDDVVANVILMTAATAKEIRKGDNVTNLPFWREALASQGFDYAIMRRSDAYIGDTLWFKGAA